MTQEDHTNKSVDNDKSDAVRIEARASRATKARARDEEEGRKG